MGLVIGFATLFAVGAAVMGCMWLLGANVVPAEKRTYLFETVDGERYNPFTADGGRPADDERPVDDERSTDGERPVDPADGTTECWSCGERTGAEYRFCGTCGTRQL